LVDAELLDPQPGQGGAGVLWISIGPQPQVNSDSYPGGATKNVSGRVGNAMAVLHNFGGAGSWVLLAGTGSGGVFRSTNLLQPNLPIPRWVELTDFNGLQGPSANRTLLNPGTGLGVQANYVTALAVCPDQLTVYVGGAAGIFKSLNGGITWTFLPGFPPPAFPRLLEWQHFVSKIIIDPTNDLRAGPTQTLYAAVAPIQFRGPTTAVDGIYKSRDGGNTWIRFADVVAGAGGAAPPGVVSDLEFISSGVASFALFAALGDQAGAINNGLYRSFRRADSSIGWAPVGGTGSRLGRICLACDHQDTMYVAVAQPTGRQLLAVFRVTGLGPGRNPAFVNTDAQANFIEGQSWFNLAIGLSPPGPGGPRRVYLAGQTKVYEKVDNQGQWWRIAIDNNAVDPHTDHHSFAFFVTNDGMGFRMIDGNDGGVWLYAPALAARQVGTWTNLNTTGLQSHKVAGLGVNPTNIDKLVIGSDDNGVARTLNGGGSWQGVGHGDGQRVRYAADGSSVYATTNMILERSADGSNGSWTAITPNVDVGVSAIATNPSSPRTVLAAGAGRVWQTMNGPTAAAGGGGWIPVTPPGAGAFGAVTAVSYAPLAGGNWTQIAYVGYGGGRVFQTINAVAGRAANWVNVSDGRPNPPRWGNNVIASIAPDPRRPGQIYIAFAAYGVQQVWFTNNSALSWNQIARAQVFLFGHPLMIGLPNVPVRSLLVDPQSANPIVYAGTEVGVYRGIQAAGGSWSWKRFGSNFPNVSVWDLQLQTNVLFAATDGRGVWQLLLEGPAGAPVEGTSATGISLDTFTDPAGSGTQTVQSIDWGDGTALDTTSGSITWSGTTATVKGNHTYAHYGTYLVTITIAKSGRPLLVLTSAISVQDATLTATGTAVSATANTALNNVQVATFTDANTLSTAGNFIAVIFWGDNTTSLGTVTGGSGNFTVTGSHTYTTAGSLTVSVTITEDDGPNYALASSTATVSGALNMQAVAVTATEASSTGNVTVATFTDTYAHPLTTDYTATLNWADGHISTGTVATNPGGGFKITGSNTYSQAGTFALTILLTNIRGAAATIVNPVSVTDAALTALGMTLTATQGNALTNVVLARFTDADPAAGVAQYEANIDWGDGGPPPQEGPPVQDPGTIGTVVLETGGTFAVLGGHTYALAGTYTITVSLSDAGGSTLSVISTVTVPAAAPTVTGIDTLFGSTAGGTAVTISGSLAAATAVKFGTIAASVFQINADGTITAIAPAQSAGTVDITVTTPNGTSATSPADQFTYLASAPAVTAVSPTSGPTGGGTSVTITGTNLAGAAQVYFGTIAATDFTINSATSVTATAPAQAAGVVDLTVSGPYGVSATSGADQFAYTGTAPAVTGLDITSGPTAGGTVVTISGSNLNGATGVAFGANAASSFTVLSATTIRAVAPAGTAGTVDVTVTNPYGTSSTSTADQFSYLAAPTVTGVSPSSGPVGGGTSVTISGTNFTGATQVLFGSVPAAAYTVVSATSVTATAPPQAPATLDVTVTTPGGVSATSGADQYTYQSTAPSVSAVSPNRGPTAGGTTVTTTGANFTGATAVNFGTTAASSFTVTSDTQITAIAPAESAGTVDITVTTPYGTSAVGASDQFIFADAAPATVTGVSPNSGAMAGGTSVTLTGSGFTAATTVTFGSVAATTFSVVSDTQITVTAPPQAAGTVDVIVTTPYGASTPAVADGFTYLAAAPAVTGISPTTGTTAGGTAVTISGSNFTGATRVAFGTVLATSFTVNSDGSISATAPVQATGTVDVTVTTPWGTSSTGVADQFTYTAATGLPTVTAVSPTSGPAGGGTAVTITGTGFTGATAVLFGTANAVAFQVSADTSVTATAPAQTAGTVDVRVITPAGISTITAGDHYTFTATAPAVTAVAPNSGPSTGGTVVTLSGSNLNGATAVKFGTTAATAFTVNSANQITATAPAHSPGTNDITVTTPYGTSATGSADRFTFAVVPAPAVTGVSPASGPMAGGNVVTVTGTNFTGATAVNFGSTAAAGFSVVSATQIVAISPVLPAGTVDITVTTPSGTSAIVAADHFVFSTSAPTVTAISPNNGPPAGGTSVVLTGTNYSGVSAVYFGTVSASFTVNSSTQITATAPAQAAGAVDITVVASGGTSAASSADVFSYLAPVPSITSVSPNSGATGGGTAVTITGSAFTGASQVLFGSTAAELFILNTDTSITAVSPLAAAGTVDITVTTAAGTSATTSADHFTYTSGSATPSVTGLSPTSGPTSGGTAVTISGTNLGGATQVLFGLTPALSFTVNSATSITAPAPFQSAGTVDVTVTTLGGISSTTASDQYTYVATLPTVTGVSPNTGSTSGAEAVTITGTKFSGASQVLFGSVPASTFTVNSDTSISAVAPLGAPGTVDVTVTTAGGTSATSSADHFTYTAAAGLPTVTGISPTSGPTGGGTALTVTGTNFTNVLSVAFGAVAAGSWTVNSPTSLSATAPYQAAGTVDITVTTPAGTSASSGADQFTFTGTAPSVSAISPASGTTLGGTQVTITGANLNGATQVSFGGTAATAFVVNSSSQVVATAPALTPGTYDVTVTTPYGTSSTSPADQFTAVAMPTVTGVSPSSGPTAGGTSVTITGTNFTGMLSVAFGSQAATALAVNSSTQITATAPASNAGTVDITVTSSAGTSVTSGADQFTYLGPVPTVTGVSPNSGPTSGGTVVTVTGSGFTGATAVSFGANAGSNIQINSDSSLNVTSPSSATGGTVDVRVTGASGMVSPTTSADQFSYIVPP
jgi:hypothetical protein